MHAQLAVLTYLTHLSNTSSLLASRIDVLHTAAGASNRSEAKLRECHECCVLRIARIFTGYPP